MKTFSFFNKIKRQLIPATARAIKAWTTGNAIQLWEALHDISAFQLALFQPMIPESIRPIWQQGLDTGSHCMKLCGSGGGGYVMLFEHIS
jgi:mevalonate kinase